MNPDNETIKILLRSLKPQEPPDHLTGLVLERIQHNGAGRSVQTRAWFFFITGFFFFSLFLILAVGVRFWADQGVSLDGLNMVRNAVFLVSLLMVVAGLGLNHGGKWGTWTAYGIAVALAIGIGVSSISFSLKVSELPATLAVLGYGLCGVAMAIILLKGLSQHEKHG
ncbi:MAG: hypothetical protein JEZ02_21925 [Desulfatibacillum sp.]|nr:hypothetical protein [Desulfatibacillum sp.]